MVVDNGFVENIFCEDGKEDNFAGDPFDVSDADTMLEYLQNVKELRREEIARFEEEQAQAEAEQEVEQDNEE